MKVLQLGKFYPIKGGVEKVMYDMVNSLSERNIRCDMLCTSFEVNANSDEIIINKNAKIFVCPAIITLLKTKISPQLIITLKKIANNYDIIHIHHPDPMVAVALFLSNYKRKVVLHWHSDILNQKKMLFFYKPLQKWLLKRANLVLTTSESYAKYSEYLQPYLSKTSTLPIGIEDKSLFVDKELVNLIKEKHQGKSIVFTLGRLVYYKGYEYFIEAAAHLPDNFIFLIGGNGPLETSLIQKIEKLGLQSKVFLLGYISEQEALAYYAACDIFCLSSTVKTEAFAIVQLEAMLFSKPIVSTNIPGSGVPWVNENNVSGLVVDVKNPREMASAILKIIENEDIYNLFCTNSRKRYDDNFTLDKMCDKLLQFYTKI